METVSASLVTGKTVLLRLDLDVPLKKSTDRFEVAEDFRLRAGLDTLKLCLEHAKSVIIMGHLGRPNGVDTPDLSVAPVVAWFEEHLSSELPAGKLHVLENLRFEPGEDSCDLDFAKQLASLGNFFVNEAFASHHPASSTTILPTLLPHAAGLRFAKEVEVLTGVLNNPRPPLVAVIGGAKIDDKLAVVNRLSKIASVVLIGGKLIAEIRQKGLGLPSNVMVGSLNESGFDLAAETRLSFQGVLSRAAQVVWSGPMGKFEDGYNDGNKAIIQAIQASGAAAIIGGGDTINALDQLGLLNQFNQSAFISTGGGAMLKLLADGTLPTIEALK